MRAVRLSETRVPGVFWGEDRRLYQQVIGTEAQCCRCGMWAQTLFRWGTEGVCERHVRMPGRTKAKTKPKTKTRIRMTTTFAWRVIRTGEGNPSVGTVVRRGDERPVAGPPERCGLFDKFEVSGGYVLVPRSRWAWA